MSHTVEIISVGTELLLGNIVNSDAQMLSRKLSELGLNVYYHTVVGDNPERLKQAVETAKGRADILITTGGLGPTCDDLTKQTLAAAFGKKLVLHEDIADELRAWFARRGQKMTENNLQQAQLPEGCTIFPNACGTAPGCAFQAEGKHVLMLPGPPSECKDMFEKQAMPYLAALGEGVICSRTLKIFGMGESKMESLLREKMNVLTNPTLAPYAKEGECELRITAKAADEDAARALIAPVEEEVRALLGDVVYGADVPNLETVVLELLKEKNMTLGTAESCTGGLIAKRLTDIPGSSAVFRGGVVSYCNAVKAAVLGVPEKLLEEVGAVSEPVARAMAEGARKALGCDLALAATGVAGPGSDERGNPAGLVYIALAAPDQTFVRTMSLSDASRERVRTTAAHHALDMARRYLCGLFDENSGK
ncbi:MAG: competence/damage-inducible protein A [Oscillospiraceae bacterium]